MLKISAVYLIGKAEIPIHYTIWALVEQALLLLKLILQNNINKKKGLIILDPGRGVLADFWVPN